MKKFMLYAWLGVCLLIGYFTGPYLKASLSNWSTENRIERKQIALERQMKAEPRIDELFEGEEGEIVSLPKTLGETGLVSTVVKSHNGFILSAWALSTQTLTVGQKVKILRVECGGNETGMSGSNNEAYWILTGK